MEKIVIANLKMNMDYNETLNYINEINDINDKRVVICPSNLYLSLFKDKNYSVGIQNIADIDNGAYTGETSAWQASSMGVKYAIVGHSERRMNFFETNEMINKKIFNGLKNNLNIVLCIGETKEEKDNGKTKEVLKEEIINCLKNIKDFNNIIIAYEPIWSIGTSVIPTISEIEDITYYIQSVVKTNFNYDNIKVLYGGSVNPNNIENINEINALSGVLVGGASLISEKIKRIKEVVLK